MDEIGAPDAEAIAFSGVFRMFGAGQLIVGAREKAELPHNLERAGIPRKVAMQMVGHRTESIYRRYHIVAESDIHEAGARNGSIP